MKSDNLHLRFFFLTGVVIVSLFTSCLREKESGLIRASGTIEAVEVNVASKVNGQVMEIHAWEGSHAEEGDVLAVIDSSPFEIQLRQAEAGAALADAQLRLLQKGARPEDIRQAEEALRQTDIGLKLAQEDFNRMIHLYRQGSVPLKQREDAEARYKVAETQYKSAIENLGKLKQLVRPEEIKAAEARLAQASAGVDLLKKTISDCTIKAPVRGIVARKAAERGEFLPTGGILLTLSNLEEVDLMIYVTGAELGRIKPGQSAEIHVDSHPEVFYGSVVFISSEAEFTPKNIQTREERVKLVYGVKIKIRNPEFILKSGMPADAVIKTDTVSTSE